MRGVSFFFILLDFGELELVNKLSFQSNALLNKTIFHR